MARNLLLLLAGILGLAILIVGTQYLASESGEVVVLQTRDVAGAVHQTRLWVVDHEGSQWLRAGDPSRGWFPRLSTRPDVVLVRGSLALPWRAVPTPEARDTINDLMHEKYGFADSYISFFFSREKKIPVRLLPVTPSSSDR